MSDLESIRSCYSWLTLTWFTRSRSNILVVHTKEGLLVVLLGWDGTWVKLWNKLDLLMLLIDHFSAVRLHVEVLIRRFTHILTRQWLYLRIHRIMQRLDVGDTHSLSSLIVLSTLLLLGHLRLRQPYKTLLFVLLPIEYLDHLVKKNCVILIDLFLSIPLNTRHSMHMRSLTLLRHWATSLMLLIVLGLLLTHQRVSRATTSLPLSSFIIVDVGRGATIQLILIESRVINLHAIVLCWISEKRIYKTIYVSSLPYNLSQLTFDAVAVDKVLAKGMLLIENSTGRAILQAVILWCHLTLSLSHLLLAFGLVRNWHFVVDHRFDLYQIFGQNLVILPLPVVKRMV